MSADRTLGSRFRAAFLTGASAGLGAAFARMLLDEGVAVWGTARDASRLQAFAADPGFHPVVADLHQVGAGAVAYQRGRDEAGGFDLVINNAGYGLFGPFVEVEHDRWEAQVRAMLIEPMHLAQLALREFQARGRGTLVNVASLAVEYPLPFMSGYNVVKAGLAALSESLQAETAGSEVRVLDFRPGDFRTGFNRAMAPLSAVTPSDPRRTRAWRALEQHLEAAPPPELAARDLRRALLQGRRGTVRSGGWFQARFAAPLAGCLPQRLRRSLRERYFGGGAHDE